MPRFLALDWDQQQLHVVSATVSGGGVRIQRAAVWQEQQSPNPAEAEALGQALRDRLKSVGIAAAPVLACIARDRTIMKEVRYPAVPPAEEPAVVRFQAVKELTDPPEEVVIDYTPLGESGGEQRALALVVRRELLQTYQTLCKAAGLKLVGLTPRPFGTLACLKRMLGSTVLTPAPEPADAAVAVLLATERWAEFTIMRGDQLLFARPLPVGPGLAGEVRRNLAVYNGQTAQQPARALYLAASGEQAALRDRLQALLSIPVHPLDPFAGEELPDLPGASRGAFAGAAGLLYAQAEKRPLPINFVRPKQPRPPKDPNKQRLLIGAAVAAVVLLGTVFLCYRTLAQKQQDVEFLFFQKKNLETQVAQVDEDAKRLKALDDWNQGNVVWLDELYDLTDRLPDVNSVRVTNLAGDPLPRGSKDKHAAKMTIKGITTDDYHPLDLLMNHLAADNHYRVEPKRTGRNTTYDRRTFSQQFETHVDVEKVPPEKYTSRLAEAPPEDPNRRGRSRRGGAAMPNFGFGLEGGQP